MLDFGIIIAYHMDVQSEQEIFQKCSETVQDFQLTRPGKEHLHADSRKPQGKTCYFRRSVKI